MTFFVFRELIKIREKFLENIKKYNMLEYSDKVLIAVSGGMDSMSLFHNMVSIKDEYNLDMCVCHLNHGLRNTAKRDEEFVKKYCEDLKIKVFTKKVDMNKYAEENKLSSEDAGRKLRYEFFNEIAGNDRKIFLAHNANDQAETVLFRIIRGTGIDGLCAMEYVTNNLYRPLLNIKRLEIEDYIHSNKVEYVQDETNFEDIYSRNKLRLKLIPFIEENLNSNFVDSLIRLSEISKDNTSYIREIVESYINKNYKNKVLDLKDIGLNHDYICKEIIREFLRKSIGNIEGITKKNIEDIFEMIKTSTSSKITVRGISVERSYDSLYISEDFPKENIEPIVLKCGINETKLGKFIVNCNENIGEYNKYISIDKDKIKGDLVVRNRRNGDRFNPIGMKTYKKLKDYFVDEKIEKYKRDITPIVCDEEDIIWVCPYRMSDKYKITKNTKNIVNIILEENND